MRLITLQRRAFRRARRLGTRRDFSAPDAVSELVGSVLLVGITVASMVVVGALVFSVPGPPAATRVERQLGPAGITLYHGETPAEFAGVAPPLWFQLDSAPAG